MKRRPYRRHSCRQTCRLENRRYWTVRGLTRIPSLEVIPSHEPSTVSPTFLSADLPVGKPALQNGSPPSGSRARIAQRLTWVCRSFQIDSRMDDLDWFVAHTRPRCEKKLLNWCTRESLDATLPCYTTVHKYRGKVVRFEKPLFPGYLFLKLTTEQARKVSQSDYVARVLTVVDQELFHQQLMDILEALDKCADIQVVPEIGEGTRVRVKHGPLRGMEGWVERRYGMTTVIFRLDFIGQAAAVKLEAWELEPA